MKSIRIGKDLSLFWDILTNGEAISLSGRNLKLIMIDPKGKETELPLTTSNNTLTAVFYGKDHEYCGTYGLTLWENYGTVGQTAVDKTKAFKLVPTTDLERDNE